jgi:hypothetical protein
MHRHASKTLPFVIKKTVLIIITLLSLAIQASLYLSFQRIQYLSDDNTLTNLKSGTLSVRRLGFGSPRLDPSCLDGTIDIVVDGECSSSQLGNYLATIYMSILRAKQRNLTFTFLCRNGSASIYI